MGRARTARSRLLLGRACDGAAVALSPDAETDRPLPARPAAVRAAEVLTVLPARSELSQRLVPEPLLFVGPSPFPGPPPSGPDEQASGTEDGPRSSSRNATIMAAGTTLSRASGFARILAVAWVLGQARLADAYNLANTVPNTIYDLLLGGVLFLAGLIVTIIGAIRKSNKPKQPPGATDADYYSKR